MLRRSDRVRMGAAILAAGLAFAAAGCKGKPEDAGTAVRRSDLRFLPPGTAGLAVIEVGRFKDRAAVGRWLDDFTKEAGLTGGLDRVRAALGPDALEKLDRLSLALVPVGGTTGYAVLAEGRFDEKTVKNLTGGGLVTLVEVGTSPDLSITALPQNHLALGPKAVLEQVRAAAGIAGAAPAAGGATGKGLLDSPVMRVLDKVSPARHVWGGIDYGLLSSLLGDADKESPPGGSPMSGFTRNLRAVAFQGEIDSAVEFDLIGVADGEPGAKTLSDAARGLVAIARVGASQGAKRAAEPGASADPGAESARAWMKFLDGVTIAQSREEIRVHGVLDGTMAKSFADAASRSVPGAGAP